MSERKKKWRYGKKGCAFAAVRIKDPTYVFYDFIHTTKRGAGDLLWKWLLASDGWDKANAEYHKDWTIVRVFVEVSP